jgi:uncharacterized protein
VAALVRSLNVKLLQGATMNRHRLIVWAMLLMAGSLARAAETEQPRTISTSGEATVYVVPDEVVAIFGVSNFDESLENSRRVNEEEAGKLLKSIKAMGIDDKQIQTQDMQVEIRYKTEDNVAIRGYVVRRQYAVTLKDAKRLEELVTTALKNGANHLLGVEYRTTELRKHRDEARKMAIRAAKEKARDLAAELECDLGKPRTIGEASMGYWGPAMGRWGGSQWMMQNSVQQAATGGEGGETMPLGQIGIRATVSVTFDLNPR